MTKNEQATQSVLEYAESILVSAKNNKQTLNIDVDYDDVEAWV